MDNDQDPIDAEASRVPSSKDSKGSTSPGGTSSDSPAWVSKRGSAGLDHKGSVLVVELVHLLGLFLTHSRYSKSALATEALFNQLLRHVELLSWAVGDDNSLYIRQIAQGDQNRWIPEFQVQCGPVVIHGGNGWHGLTAPSSPMLRALAQAFGCLAEQGIRTLKLNFGDRSKKQNERLRLALNIVARFFHAVDSNASITFRYFGRALTIPLIRDKNGQPDPNLTVLAGLNGLSEANTRELIKQAESFYALRTDRYHADPHLSCYDRIFGLRSLRAQLIRSPVEINLAPLLETFPDSTGESTRRAGEGFEAIHADAKQHHHRSKNSLLTEVIETGYSLRSLSACLQAHDKAGQQQLSKVFSADVTQATPQSLAVVFHDISSLIHHIERQPQNSLTGHVIFKFLSERVERIPDAIIEKMTIHRQSISLSSGDQNIVIGMMHPRLLDLVTLSKERVLTRRKFVAMQTLGFTFDDNDIATLAEKFEINDAEVEHAITTLKSCFTDGKHFCLRNLKKQFPVVIQQADTLFEMLWCYLKQTDLGQERLDLITAIGICGQHLRDVKHAFRFLLSDIYHDPFDLNFSDRNAFLLVNALLASDRRRLTTLSDSTPENLIQNMNETNKENQIYAAWRLDFDQVRVLTKQRTLNDALVTSLLGQPDGKADPLKSSFIFSLEREALLFLAVSGGETARIILRDVIIKYGKPTRDFYRSEPSVGDLRRAMANLQIAVRGIGRVGEQKDLNLLKELERGADKLKTIYADFMLARQVNEMMSRISMAIKAIQMRL